MSSELAIRFLVGGLVVSVFAVVGNLFKPKSFGGLFGAAPSVALATLVLTVFQSGNSYASTEARSMIAGAMALYCYSMLVAFLLARRQIAAIRAALYALPAWFGVAFALCFAFLK